MTVQPLSVHEEAVWRLLIRLVAVLPRAIDEDLQSKTGLSLTNYVVLMHLSESPGQQLRMSDIAQRAAISPSRITRVVDSLAADGFVERIRSVQDRRANLAHLTQAGQERLRSAWPGHLSGVRDLVLDQIAPRDLSQLSRIIEPIIARVDSGPWPDAEPSGLSIALSTARELGKNGR